MKKYILVLDTTTVEGGGLFVAYASSVKQAKQIHNDLNLSYAPKKMYCSCIGKRIKKDHYEDILRTDDGLIWNREPHPFSREPRRYNPSSWTAIANWKNLSDFQIK